MGKANTYIHPYCTNGHSNPPKSYKRELHVTSLTQNGHLEVLQPKPPINHNYDTQSIWKCSQRQLNKLENMNNVKKRKKK